MGSLRVCVGRLRLPSPAVVVVGFHKGAFPPATLIPRLRGWVSTTPLLSRKSNERSPQGSNLPETNVSVTLPPEIVDKFLDHHTSTTSEGRQTLMTCALVATWWTGPSQRRLFSSVSIYEGNYERWIKGVALSGPKAHLLEHVRSLKHCRGLSFRTKYRMRDLPQDSGEYLSALPNLRRLTLFNARVERIGEEGFQCCFSVFRGALTYLSLDTVATSFSAFVTLVGYFPNIRTLQLRSLVLEPDEGSVPTLNWPLRGKIHIHAQPNFPEFFGRLAELDLEYEELLIVPSYHAVKTRFLESVLQISTDTVKLLRLIPQLPREYLSTRLFHQNHILTQPPVSKARLH